MDIQENINSLYKCNSSFVVASVVKTAGSTPGKVGFKMVIEADGKTSGTVGGGGIEVQVISDALSHLKSKNNELVEYILSDSIDQTSTNVVVVQMSCNGKIWIYYEVFNVYPTIYVFGGGHVGKALLSILSNLPYKSILIDNRSEFANKINNPDADEVICKDYKEYVSEFIPDSNSFIVVLTHKHIYDYDIAESIYRRKLQVYYVGIISSKSKANGIISKLKVEISPELNISNLFSPIGLDLGGDSAYEIALCIAAQIQSIYYKKIEKYK